MTSIAQASSRGILPLVNPILAVEVIYFQLIFIWVEYKTHTLYYSLRIKLTLISDS